MCIMSTCDPVSVGHAIEAMDFRISFVNSVSALEPILIFRGFFSISMGNLSSVRIGQWSDSPHFPTLQCDSQSFLGRKMRSIVDEWDTFSGKYVAHFRFWYVNPLLPVISLRNSTKGELATQRQATCKHSMHIH